MVAKSLYLISSVALTFMVVSMALYFVNAIKEEQSRFNFRKAKLFICVVAFIFSLTSLGIALDLVIDVLNYTGQ